VEAASNVGLDFHEIKKRAVKNENQIIEEIKANQKDQLNAGHHGVPLSVYKNNYFFGQDRFNDLVEELKKDGLNHP
jgi:2-hydroxychromene-2-carboxylate isomerase